MGDCAINSEGVDLADVLAGRTSDRTVYSQYETGALTIASAITDQHKYAWSAADGRAFLFDRQSDRHETRNRAGVAFHGGTEATMRERLMEALIENGQGELVDGGKWRQFPPAPTDEQIRANPDACLLVQDPRDWQLDLPGYSN
jgi:hypothetical protein